jgi:hypothetical protein
LLVSSSVSLSIPFTVGKLIDYFTSPNPVRQFLPAYMRLCEYVAAFLPFMNF